MVSTPKQQYKLDARFYIINNNNEP
uniref:Uncharacterized protein n=1 Tax=Rhizophora mucronata TaxID=61149 RepID=A0A2P2P6G2_RHIMU